VDYQAIYCDLVMRRFWWEARLGLQVAFYRTYAVPSIARLLLKTGEITGLPLKRGYDTGIITRANPAYPTGYTLDQIGPAQG
jgi:hypothetical protein